MSSKRLISVDSNKTERVIIAAGVTPQEEKHYSDTLIELAELVKTASGEVVGQIVQKIPHLGQSGFLGKGKLEELASMVLGLEADLVAFDADLKPSQAKKIEEAIKCKVVDRTEVILSIFAGNARTNEARLQVELAQLEYAAPRQKHRWGHLWRQSGVSIGSRGPGEKQIEVDRRELRKRMTELRREIDTLKAHKTRMVKSRPLGFTVSLVGYTNSGKSTLLNRLTNAGVLSQNKLFSTLDTRTRKLVLDKGFRVFLSDTVGFIRKLPTHLVASFYATLEETRQARLLLHIIDASSHDIEMKIEAVNDVLKSLECESKPTMLVFNKTDIVSSLDLNILKDKYPDAEFISAASGGGINRLLERLREQLLANCAKVRVRIPHSNAKLIADSLDSGFVVNAQYDGEHAIFDMELPSEDLGRLMSRGAEEVVES